MYLPCGLAAVSGAGWPSESKIEAVATRGGVGKEMGGPLLVKTASSAALTGLSNDIV